MKSITIEEAKYLLIEVGCNANVTMPVKLNEKKWHIDNEGKWVKEEWKTILNNSLVYNPFFKTRYGAGSTPLRNAEKAILFIKDRFKIYSNVFHSASGEYIIED